VWLVVDETALRERERRDWLGSVCSRVDITARAGRVDLFDGRRRFALYKGRVRPAREAGANPDECIVWTQAAAAAAARADAH
jgi:hypothetical protein